MSVDYYALLKQAVADKDAAGRNRIYTDALQPHNKNSTVTREVAAGHATALADAIRQIESEIAHQRRGGPS